jgi:hypothetical protein
MKLDKITKASIILIALSISYYLVIFLPHKEKEIIETSEKHIVENKKALDSCLKSSRNKHQTNWNNTCLGSGQSLECGLPDSKSQRLEKIYTEDKDNCFKRYPQ